MTHTYTHRDKRRLDFFLDIAVAAAARLDFFHDIAVAAAKRLDFFFMILLLQKKKKKINPERQVPEIEAVSVVS